MVAQLSRMAWMAVTLSALVLSSVFFVALHSSYREYVAEQKAQRRQALKGELLRAISVANARLHATLRAVALKSAALVQDDPDASVAAVAAVDAVEGEEQRIMGVDIDVCIASKNAAQKYCTRPSGAHVAQLLDKAHRRRTVQAARLNVSLTAVEQRTNLLGMNKAACAQDWLQHNDSMGLDMVRELAKVWRRLDDAAAVGKPPSVLVPNAARLRVIRDIRTVNPRVLIHMRERGDVAFMEPVASFALRKPRGSVQAAQFPVSFAPGQEVINATAPPEDSWRYLIRVHHAWLTQKALLLDQTHVWAVGNNGQWREEAPKVGSMDADAWQSHLVLDEVFVLSTLWASEYWHFFGETMPRLMLALDWLRANPHVHILADGTEKAYVRQALSRLGLMERVVCRNADLMYFAPVVWFARPTRFGSPTVEEATRLHTEMVGQREPDPEARDRVILVQRHPNKERSWGNARESERMAELVRFAMMRVNLENKENGRSEGTLQFVQFNGDLNLAETIELFSHSAVIVGGEGAGLVNAMFASSTSMMMEVNSEDRQNWCHYTVANVRGMDYWLAQASTWEPRRVFSVVQDKQLEASLRKQLPEMMRAASDRLAAAQRAARERAG